MSVHNDIGQGASHTEADLKHKPSPHEEEVEIPNNLYLDEFLNILHISRYIREGIEYLSRVVETEQLTLLKRLIMIKGAELFLSQAVIPSF